MFRLFECCALSFFERFVLSFSLKIERFVSDSAEIWICGLYFMSNLVEEVFHKNKKDRKLGLMVSTHSPYIVNHLNVLLRAGYFEKARENYPFLEKDDIAVYRVNEGKIISLMATDNDTGEYVINALDMSDTMERIFEEYESMEE